MSVLEEIKYRLRQNNAVYRIITINVLIFLVLAIVHLLFSLFKQGPFIDSILDYLKLPSYPGRLVYQPWSIFTHMFLHFQLLHLLFNMLWFYWFGLLFQQYLGNTKTYQVFFTGGVFGGLLYILSYNVFPVFAESVHTSIAWGASAGVLAIVVATATLLPDYQLGLFLIGPVRLKYIALFSVALDLISITGTNADGNAGGHIAHLGGAAFGYLYIKALYSNAGIPVQIMRFFDYVSSLFKPRPKMKIHHKTTSMRVENNQKPSQVEIDMILDKISKNGYESLNKREKEILFKASKD